MTLEAKRQLIEKLRSRFDVDLLCELLGLSLSSFYYDAVAEVDDGVRAEIVSIAQEFPVYGYRMITAELKRRTFEVNAKRVRRLMHEEKLVISVRRYVIISTCSRDRRDWPNLLKNQEITQLDQAWAADITHIELGRGFVCLAVIIDVFSRGIRGWHLGSDLSSELAHRALDRALAMHDPPKIHHSDRGVQYLSEGYLEKLASHGIAVSCSAKGKPTQNGKCERFIRTLKESEVRLQEYEDLADARRKVRKFLEDVYMTKRLHSSLDYVTPAEFEESCRTKSKGKSKGS